MADTGDHGTSERGGDLQEGITAHRVEAFSDGVMAVVITLTAFEIRPPHGTDLAALGHQLPGLMIYLLSFLYIGTYWNNHHHLLRRTEQVDATVMWANLHLLFWLSLVPILTEWVATSYRATEPAAVYGIAALAAAGAYTVLTWAIVRANGGAGGPVARALGSDLKGRISLGVYAGGVVLSFVTPYLAYAMYGMVVVIWFVPDRRLAR
jgi:uncharacterized membrane protein